MHLCDVLPFSVFIQPDEVPINVNRL